MEENLNLIVSTPSQNTILQGTSMFVSKKNRKKKYLLTIFVIVIAIPLLLFLFRVNIEILIEDLSIPQKAELVKRFQQINSGELNNTALPYKNLQNNNVYDVALNISNPKIVWQHQSSGSSIPVIYNNNVYFNDYQDYGSVLALADGKEIWKYKNNISNNYPLSLALSNLYGTTNCGRSYPFYTICSIDPSTSKILWRFKTREVQQAGAESVAHFYARRTSDIKIANDIVYFTAEDNYLYALNAVTGEKIWEFTDKPYEVADLSTLKGFAIDNNLLFVYNGVGKFYALDTSIGKVVWDIALNLPQYTYSHNPVVANGKIFLPLFNGTMYVFDEVTGEKLWEYTSTKLRKTTGAYSYISEPAVHENSVYISDNAGYLYELNAADGREVNKLSLGNYSLSTPVITQNQIYILSTGENLSKAMSLLDVQDGVLSVKSKSVLFGIDRKSLKQKWSFDLTGDCANNCSWDNGQRFPIIFQDKLLVAGGTSLYLVADGNR
jgi:outer membrane protein assembly factor BamB